MDTNVSHAAKITAKDPLDRHWIGPMLSEPGGSAYLDRIAYKSVHFYGARLCDPLGDVVRYLMDLERALGAPPHVLCLHHEFSHEDGGSELAWRVTLVIGAPEIDLANGAGGVAC
jgi:hypothetical protein